MKRITCLFISLMLTMPIGAEEPDWVNKAYDRAGYYVGLGMADSPDKAKSAAMVDLSRGITATVSSSTSSSVTTNGNEVNKQSQSQYQMSSDDVMLNLLTWEKVETHKGITYALAKVSTAEFIRHYEQYLEAGIHRFLSVANKAQFTLNDYVHVQKQQDKLNDLVTKAQLISSNSIQATGYLQQLMLLRESQAKFVQGSCFYVTPSRDRMTKKLFQDTIESLIAASGFTLENNPSCTPIYLSARTAHPHSSVAQVSLKVTFGRPSMASSIVKVEGQSAGSPMAAKWNAVDNLSAYFSQLDFIGTTLSQEVIVIEQD